MKIDELKKYNWEQEEEWYEKWYNVEMTFLSEAKGKNPLRKLWTSEGLNSLAINNIWCYESKELRQWETDRLKAVNMGLDLFTKLIPATEEFIGQIEKVLAKLEKTQKVDKSNFPEIKRAMQLAWHIFLADLGKAIGGMVDGRLSQKGFSPSQIEEVKNYYFSVNKKLAFQKEEDSLRKIKKVYLDNYKNAKVSFNNLSARIVKMLNKHWSNYRFLTVFDINTEPYSVEDFYNKLLNISFKDGKNKDPRFSVSIKKSLSSEDKRLLKLISRHIYLDNYNADLFVKLDYLLNQFLSEKNQISFSDLSYYSLGDIEKLIFYGKAISKKELEIRRNYRVMVQINGQVQCYWGQKDFNQISKLVNWRTYEKVKEISGVAASPGIVQGKVKIVKEVKDINKVEQGDILVAISTRPDYMVAIQRCAAIVTDQGGITSHAAIISREFKIPCVVRAYGATQILKDGDLVEVDANNGVVRKF